MMNPEQKFQFEKKTKKKSNASQAKRKLCQFCFSFMSFVIAKKKGKTEKGNRLLLFAS
jgi:hypothetical protein